MAASPPLPPLEIQSESTLTTGASRPVHVPAHTARLSEQALPAAQSHQRTGWLWWVIFVALIGAGTYYWPVISPYLKTLGIGNSAPPKAASPKITPVGTAKVEQRNLPLMLNALGTVTALKTVTIRSRVEGELTDISFVEGQMVNEGDLLATIDPRSYQVQKEEAEGQLARDEAALHGAELNLTRLTQLMEMKISTAQQVDDQKALVQQFAGAVKADKAQIAQADLQLTYCKILSPICGRIGLRAVDEGNMVRPTDAQGLAVITQLQPITLIFMIPQDEIHRVQRWMKHEGTIQVDAYDRDFRNRLASGKLLAIDNQVDPTNGTVRLKAEFENADGQLFPNQFVNVRMQVEELKQALIVPSSAVQRGPQGPFVYVVTPEETVELRLLKITAVEGNETAVEAGLQPGELVVTSGLDRLQPNAKVNSKGSAAATQPAENGKKNTEKPT